MKKQTLLLFMLAAPLIFKAQLPNNSFENLSVDGKIKHWGMIFLTTAWFDSSGVAHGDSIVFDHDLYFSTPDAHTGTKALEMRNAYNYTSNQHIGGMAKLMPNDSDYIAFSPMSTILQRPLNFSFYYKFFPVAGDTAFAHMQVFDSLGNEIGTATKYISATTSQYAQALVPAVYTSTDAAAFVAITFATTKPGGTASFGTRFLVDDVNMSNGVTTIVPQSISKNAIRCFPNPVQDGLNIQLNSAFVNEPGTLTISDAHGRVIQTLPFSVNDNTIHLDATAFAKGLYTLQLRSTTKTYSTTFIK